MQNETEIYRQMYAVLCSGADRALGLLEDGDAEAGQSVLQEALEKAEEIYISISDK